jgi:nucleotide-binding universal stress UspA family protein
MIRSILLPIAEGPGSDRALECACWLARKEGGLVHGLAVIDIKSFEIPVLGAPDGFMPSVVTPPVSESRSLMEEMMASARERLDKLSSECTARDIRCSTDSRTGIPAEIVLREVVAHDIVVLSPQGYTRLATPAARLDPLVVQVIRGSVRPVLVAGPPPGGEIRRIVVAFDGSSHSARALPVAADLAARPGAACTLLNVAMSEEAGRECLAPAEAFLSAHGLVPETKVAVSSRPSEVICELVSSTRADLLIMGAFGHSPVREMLFGSTTERVLARCPTSVILQS